MVVADRAECFPTADSNIIAQIREHQQEIEMLMNLLTVNAAREELLNREKLVGYLREHRFQAKNKEIITPTDPIKTIVERATVKRAQQIIDIKNLTCKDCIFTKNVKSLPAFCATGERNVFNDTPACVSINPTPEAVEKINADGGIKVNMDGEMIP